jgi:hypothetical protein
VVARPQYGIGAIQSFISLHHWIRPDDTRARGNGRRRTSLSSGRKHAGPASPAGDCKASPARCGSVTDGLSSKLHGAGLHRFLRHGHSGSVSDAPPGSAAGCTRWK